LVVDDDPLQLRAIQRAAREHRDVELTALDNSIDALLAIGAAKPDLVVLDLYMPGLDGLEVCRRIKANEETGGIDVVIASAAMNEELERAARDAGATAALAKPVRVEALREIIPPAPPTPIEELVSAVTEPGGARPTRGANVLVGMLEDAGVDVVFGLPGGAISPVHDALLDSHIRVVTTRHEAGAMFAAAAYARATGKIGVVAVTSGPGALNSMTGLATALCDDVPLLLLIGEVPRAAHGKGVLQDGSSLGLQIVEMARHVSKLAAEIPRASALPHLVRRALATAQSGRKGPVVLTLPLDVTTADVVMPRVVGAVTVGAMVEPESLDEIAALVIEAHHPLILAGNGMRGDGAPERLRTVAERLGCPVATTPKGKGVFPESHPLSVGVVGLGGHPSAREYLEQGCDVIIAICRPTGSRRCSRPRRSCTSTSTRGRSARATRRRTPSSRPRASSSAASPSASIASRAA
jgi:CheY-like chemotaxis protein